MRLTCRTLTPQEFAPFGAVIDTSARLPELINEGTTRRYSDLASFDLGDQPASPVIGIYVASARAFPLRIGTLERHRRASQLFMPLGLHRFAVLVAPGDDAPDWKQVKAFLTSPGQGVCLARGTWHHGLVALADGDRFAVIEGRDYRADTELKSSTENLWLDRPFTSP